MKHTLMIGDALKRIKEIPDNSIDHGITSPPYFNAKEYSGIDGDVGKSHTYQEYLDKLQLIIKEHFRVLKPGTVFTWNTSPVLYNKKRYMIPFDSYNLFIKEGFICHEIISWVKPSGSARLRCGKWCVYNRPHSWHANIVDEMIAVFKKPGEPAKKPYAKLTKYYPDGIPRDMLTSIWKFHVESNWQLHPAQFPPELPKRSILLYSYPGDVVLDAYVGSGTTMKMCRELGRNSIGIELNPDYIEIAKEKIGFYQKDLFNQEEYEVI